MRILHTSDWHLGRTLHGVDLLSFQAAFVDHLVDVVRDRGVEAVLVAGDVYDRAVPPVGAVSLLSDALARLAEHADVVVTPGNHDSAIRLGFGADLMRPGIHLRTRLSQVGEPVVIAPRSGRGRSVAVYALPYLDPDTARWAFAERTEPDAGAVGAASPEGGVAALVRSHAAVMGAAMRRVGVDLAERRGVTSATDASGRPPHAVVMAHAFVVGGTASESERDIRVGGVDSVPGDVFGGCGLDYVALGHLHGPQAVTVHDVSRGTPGEERLVPARYSGSPLAYSFSELHQRKSSVVVDLDTGDVDLVDCPVPRRLAELTGTLAELLGPLGEDHLDDWLRVTVTDPLRPRDLYTQVKARFPHALQVAHRPPDAARRESIAVVGPGRDPLDVTRDFVVHVTGVPPTDTEAAAVRTALEAALAAERSA